MFEKNKKTKDLEAEIARLQGELDACASRPKSSEFTENLLNRIAELEKQVTLLSEINKDTDDGTSSSDLIIKLRDGLLKAKATIVRQEQTIKELTTEPLLFAVVIQMLDHEIKEQDPLKIFKNNVAVRIRKDSEYYDQRNGVGIIVDENRDHGWVSVKFENDEKLVYRIGLKDVDHGACDLELAQKPLSEYPSAIVFFQNQLMQVLLPESRDLVITPGDTVKISSQTKQITDVVGKFKAGEISTVKSIIDDNHCEVDASGSPLVVFRGVFTADTLEDGDRIVLDSSKAVIVENLGKDSKRFALDTNVQIEWSAIGGLQEAKQQMIEAIEMPFVNKKVYSFYHKKPIKGILLYGPPGCGKTLLAKAGVTALAKMYNVSSAQALQSGYIYVKGPEILTKWVGESEAIVRQLFARARKHKQKYGYPAVIFIDEAEAILRKRGSGISSDVESTIVPMFLAEMDGLQDTGAMVILATNRPDMLDPAVVRDGRIDRKIKITRPDMLSASEIFKIHLGTLPLNNGYSYDELAGVASETLFSDKFKFYDLFFDQEKTLAFNLSNIINGGMIASIVDQATSFSIRRDLKSPKKKCSGLMKDDLLQAIEFVYEQNMDINHEDDIKDLVEDTGLQLRTIKKVSPPTFVQHQIQ